ncbi:hypothetical protein GCM10009789_82990 [Kribbella sancticallisti]|uniref:Uncharacterized protein n=1 Tax=Kribbella sancticallisti TaxID=460087 RepID=A0ABP4QN56_9ACTN
MTLVLPPGPLGPPGPAQYDWLFHFTGRPVGLAATPSLPGNIRDLHPAARLDNILWEERLRGFPPFSRPPVTSPMLSFAESPLPHVQWLIGQRQWPSWALVVSRQHIYDLGGGPALHARTPLYNTLSDEQRAWAVRLETNSISRSDWLHEREWRLPVPPDQPWLDLSPYPRPTPAAAVLLGDPNWQPSTRLAPFRTGRFFNGETGEEVAGDHPNAHPYMEQRWALPRIWPGLLKLYYNPQTGEIVPLAG